MKGIAEIVIGLHKYKLNGKYPKTITRQRAFRNFIINWNRKYFGESNEVWWYFGYWNICTLPTKRKQKRFKELYLDK